MTVWGSDLSLTPTLFPDLGATEDDAWRRCSCARDMEGIAWRGTT